MLEPKNAIQADRRLHPPSILLFMGNVSRKAYVLIGVLLAVVL